MTLKEAKAAYAEHELLGVHHFVARWLNLAVELDLEAWSFVSMCGRTLLRPKLLPLDQHPLLECEECKVATRKARLRAAWRAGKKP